MYNQDLFVDFTLKTAKMMGDSSEKSYFIIDLGTPEWSIIHCNEQYTNLIDMQPDDLIGHSVFEMIDGPIEDINLEQKIDKIKDGKVIRVEIRHIRKNKDAFLAEFECIPFRDIDQQPLYLLALIQDISYSKVEKLTQSIEKQLFDAIEKEASLAEKLYIICKEFDKFFHPLLFTSFILPGIEGELLSVHSRSSCPKMNDVPFSSHPLIDPYHKVLLQNQEMHVDLLDSTGKQLFAEHREYALNHNMKNCYLAPISNINGAVIGLFSIYYVDIDSEQQNLAAFNERIVSLVSIAHMYSVSQQRIHELVNMDLSTGLANYNQFMEILNNAFETGKTGYVKILEPSEFSNIVAFYGRNVGDQLLQQIAIRYKMSHTKNELHIARFSSSALIILHIMSREELNSIVFNERIRGLTRQPYQLENQKIYITLKAGIATFDNQPGYLGVISKVENALEFAKKQHGTNAKRYTIERSKVIEQQMLVANHLHFALERDELYVVLQPKVNLTTGNISSLEALVRWQSPELGFVPPIDFLPAAERIGKIRDVDNIVISKVLQWMQKRKNYGKTPCRIALNVTPEHFYAPNFVKEFHEMAVSHHISPEEIIIEVTENTGLVDIQEAIDIMNELKQYGYDISVDDFGVGYSSLSYLQKFPFKELKIDRSFVSKIHEPGTEAVVRSIVDLANFFGMDVVAEGIETEEQQMKVSELGCKTGQGFLFYKPMPLEEVNKILG